MIIIIFLYKGKRGKEIGDEIPNLIIIIIFFPVKSSSYFNWKEVGDEILEFDYYYYFPRNRHQIWIELQKKERKIDKL